MFCAFCENLGVSTQAYTTVNYVPICDFHIGRAKDGADIMGIQWRSMVKTYWLRLLESDGNEIFETGSEEE